MEEKLRKTGIDVISDAPWGTHICQFYQTNRDLIDILVPYFKAGLENNEFCMWITSEPLKVEDAKAALKKVVKNLDHFIKKGQIEILDHSEWYTKSGKFDANNVLQGWVEKEKQALKRGYDGLRLSGNTFWLAKRDWRNFTNYEEEINNVIGKYRMIAICAYSLSKCGASEVIDVISNHQFALIRREGKWVIIESSERKQAEEVLRVERDKLIGVFEAMEDGVYIVNQQYDIEYVNSSLLKEFGPIGGRKCYEYFHDRKELCPWCPNQEVFAGKTVRWEWYSIKNQKTYDLIDTPLRNPDGTISKLEIFRDITERKRAEDQLRASEQKLKDLTETTPDWIWEVDKDGIYTYVSSKVKDLLGYEVSEVLGKTPFYFMPKGEAERVGGIFKEKVIEKEPLFRIENINRHKDGHWVVLETSGMPIFDEKGNLKGYRGIDRDITERKKVEEKIKIFSNAVESAYDNFVLVDMNGNVTYTNQSALKTFGYTPDEITKLNISQFDANPENAKKIIEEMKKKGRWSGEVINIRKNKEKFPCVLTASLILDDKGKPIGMLSIFRDITEQKRAEDQLRNSEKQLRALAARLQTVREEERAMIAREIHDELGQVLTGLKIDLSWLSGKLPEDQKSLLGKTKSMSELIDTTIQSVRKLSTELRPGVLDNLGLKAAIEWQIGEFQTRTGIRCEFIAPEEDIALDRDCSTAVFRIFQETLTNVVRHSNATRVNITLEKSADRLLLEVQDNGKGIEESKIFDLKSLGLLGMRERALYWGGKIKFEGIQGKGTKVTVLIPPKGKMGEMEVRDYD